MQTVLQKLTVLIILFSSQIVSAVNSAIDGSWEKACGYEPVYEPTKLYTTIKAKLKKNRITLERNIYTNSNCKSPWSMMPTALHKGTYRILDKEKNIKIGNKKRRVVQIEISFTHFNNSAIIKDKKKIHVFYDAVSDQVYVAEGDSITKQISFKRTTAKVRTADEVFKRNKNILTCTMSFDIPNMNEADSTWCLKNINFPEKQFKALCEAETVQVGDTKVKRSYGERCPLHLVSYCDYGLRPFGYTMHRYYSKEQIRLAHGTKKACETTLRGKWHER